MPLRFLRVLAAMGPLALAAASADTIKLTNSPVFQEVRAIDFREHRLIFRGLSGQYLRPPLDRVAWLEIDGRTALSAAERLAAAGNWSAAADAYETALAEPAPDWLHGLTRVRLLSACDRAGRLERAVELYADLLGFHPASAAACVPRNVGPPGSHTNAAALEFLLGRLGGPAPLPGRGALRTLLLELSIVDDAPLPPGFEPPAPPSGPKSRPPMSQPAGSADLAAAHAQSRPATRPARLGILAEADEPARPPAGRSEPPPTLASDSLVLREADRALAAGDPARALRLIDQGWAFVGTADLGTWRLARGKTLIAAGRPVEAGVDLQALADSEPDLAAAALYYSGLASERAGRPGAGAALYRRVLDLASASEDLRALAAEGLERVGCEDPGDR